MFGYSKAWWSSLGCILVAGAFATQSIATETADSNPRDFIAAPDLAFDLTSPNSFGPTSTPASGPNRGLPSTRTTLPSWSTPARFFTINQVLAKAKNQNRNAATGIQLANVNPRGSETDASPNFGVATSSDEPFGLYTFKAPDGRLSTKWQRVQAVIRDEAHVLVRCEFSKDRCSNGELRFAQILKEAAALTGKAKIEFINQKINSAIRYTSDIAQWSDPDVWSAPTTANGKGSFDTGKGDCEDYAIAKYTALKASGIAVENLRILLVRDRTVGMDHAILATRHAGRWVLLDNRWDRLIDDTDATQFVPLFAMNDTGVKLIAAPYASKSNLAPLLAADLDEASSLSPSWGASVDEDSHGGGQSLPLFM
jgi:predicted transglutaminase-like cysteine proteinase